MTIDPALLAPVSRDPNRQSPFTGFRNRQLPNRQSNGAIARFGNL
jgi:hypothetical protein